MPPETKPKEKKTEKLAWIEYRFTGSEDFKNMEQELRAQWAHRGAGSWSLEKFFFEAMKGMVEVNSRRRRAEKVRPVQANPSAPKVSEEVKVMQDASSEKSGQKAKSRTTAEALSAPKVGGQKEKTECRVKATRYVPREEVRKIFARDGESCSYTDPRTGKRCGSNWRLELDHRVPYAHAGENTAENLRVFCRTHNRRHAVEMGLNKTIRR